MSKIHVEYSQALFISCVTLVTKPPTYEESLADKIKKGKQIYVDPQYLPPEPEDFPPEYDEDEVPDHALDEEDRTAEILKDLEITDYDNIDKILSQPEMTPQKMRSYVNKVILMQISGETS